MATSSAFPTSNDYIKYKIVVTENSYSVANNTSSVTVKVQAWRTNQGYETYGTGTCYATIDGTSYSQSISSSQKITYNSNTTLLSKTVTISHNADGKKSIYVQARIQHSRFTATNHGFTDTLTDIPRQANITAVVNFTDEGNPTITYSNPAGDVVTALDACISLTGSRDDVPYRAISKTGTQYTFNLTTAERTTLRNACPNSNTLTVYFYVRTTVAGQTYWSNMPATMTIVNANPTITGVTYKDNNSASVAVSDDDQIIIQNQSQLLFNFASLTALKSATLTSIEVTINSVPISQSLSGASQSNVNLSFGQLNVSSDISASIILTDSRNNKTAISVPITVQAWSAPTAILKLARKQNYYSDTDLTVDADFSSLGGKNSITITYYYKLPTASTWTTGGTMDDGDTVTMNLDNTEEWNVKVEITDAFYTTTYQLAVDKGIPIIFFDRQRRSMGVNTFPEHDGTLEIVGDIYANGHILDGDINFNNSGTNLRQIKGIVGDTDAFRLAGGATASDGGFSELATAGDGDEPIHVRQYSGDFANVENELTLLDANGDTSIPNNLTAGGDITATGNIQSDQVITNKVKAYSVPYTITKSSGAWSITELSAKRSGNVVMIQIQFTGSGTNVPAGGNAFEGNVTVGDLPWITAYLQSYYSTTHALCQIDNQGNVVVRILASDLNLTSSNAIRLTGTFIVDD